MGAIVNALNCAVAPAAGGAWLITKAGGNDGVPDASAVPDAPISGDFVLRARLLGTGTAFIGVGPEPLGAHDGASIPYAAQIGPNTGRIYESGLYRPPLFGLVGFIWIRRTGTTLQYLNGSDLATASVRRTVSGVAAPLHFDSSVESLDAILEVKFAPPAAFLPAKPRRPRLTLGLSL
jgi:hypothetical protein